MMTLPTCGTTGMNKPKLSIHAAAALFLTAATLLLLPAVSVRAQEDVPELAGLTFESKMDPVFAEQFVIWHYDQGYDVIEVKESASYLLVPEDGEVPEDLPEGMKVIKKPVRNIYLAASSAMSLFGAIDALDCISLSGIDTDGWYIDNARKAMEDGRIVFAGKYSQPDYELLLGSGCGLAVESTMILHTPKVQEMIELTGIPVFIDYSSYEDHPLGRTEWVRLYGCLLDKQKEADTFFVEQGADIAEMTDYEKTDLKVAFFSINSQGSAVVRAGSDYIPRMIEMGGGKYAFPELENEESSRASVTITMEEFFAGAVDADYLIYNGTIEQSIGSLEDLYELSSLFRDFKAVREGRVWAVDKDFYQASGTAGRLILDVHHMLTDEDEDQMTFLKRIQ